MFPCTYACNFMDIVDTPSTMLNTWRISSLIKRLFFALLPQDIFKDAIDSGLNSAKDLAYFEGDFWPNVIEDSIKELDQEEEEKRRREEAEAAAAEAEAQDVVEDTTDTVISIYFFCVCV